MCDGGELPEMQVRRPRAYGEAAQRERYVSALSQAQTEYDVARSCFAEAVDSEIIDEAIYLMEAARKKYSYFLRKVRDSYSSATGHGPAREPRKDNRTA